MPAPPKTIPILNEKVLEAVAKNARIQLTPAEARKFLPELNAVLSAFSTLQKANVSKVKPSFQPLAVQNVYRKDEPVLGLDREAALFLSPHKSGPYFRGPKVL